MRGREAEVGRCASPARLRTYALPATLFLSWEFSAFPTCSTSYFSRVSQMLCRAENNQEKHLLSVLCLEQCQGP